MQGLYGPRPAVGHDAHDVRIHGRGLENVNLPARRDFFRRGEIHETRRRDFDTKVSPRHRGGLHEVVRPHEVDLLGLCF